MEIDIQAIKEGQKFWIVTQNSNPLQFFKTRREARAFKATLPPRTAHVAKASLHYNAVRDFHS
jgi:hypothetical protein